MKLPVFLLGLGLGACVAGSHTPKNPEPEWHQIEAPAKEPEAKKEQKEERHIKEERHVIQDHEWYVQAACEPDRAPCPDEYPRPTEAEEDPSTVPSEAEDAEPYCPDHPEVDCSLDLRRDPDNTWW